MQLYCGDSLRKYLLFKEYGRVISASCFKLEKDDTIFLGMKSGGFQATSNADCCPLLRLSVEPSRALHLILKNVHCSFVVPRCIDSYLHNFITPDHLLGCIVECLVDACFIQCFEMRVLSIGYLTICASLKEMGMCTHNKFLTKKEKQSTTCH